MNLPADAIDRAVSAFETLDLGDPRRTQRVVGTVRKLAKQPQASIPKAMGSEAALEGAYRLFHNSRVTQEVLTEAYARATGERARAARRVLAIHDTTVCTFAHADPKSVGYLNTGKAGFMAHYTLVVDGDGSRRTLGVANLEAITRSRPPVRPSPGGFKKRKLSGTETRRKPDRESLRWLRGFNVASERLSGCDVIHVADREGDSYDLFGGALQKSLRFVVRVRVGDRAAIANGIKDSVKKHARTCDGRCSRDVPLSTRKARTEPRAAKAHPARDARTAHLTFAATEVEIARPRYGDAALPEAITLNMVSVREENPPPGESAVEWILFTTEPIDTPRDVEAIVDIYRTRWLIEECNKVLKSVCKYEERQLESREALLTLLAMTLPIACELLWLRAACRADPNQPASKVLTPTQLQILRAVASYQLPSNPSVHDAVWAVASLGGHIRSNGEPGILVLHRGMAELLAYEKGWLAREKLAELSISR